MQIVNSSLLAEATTRAYYRLEDTSDSKASYTLTNSGGLSFVSAKYGNGIYLPATSGLTRTDSLGGIPDLSAWSFAFWAKLAGVDTANRKFFNIRSNTNKIAIYMDFAYESSVHKVKFFRDRVGLGAAEASYTTELDATRFHHFAYTYDGTNLLGYIDGQQVASTTQSGNGTNSAPDGFSMGTALGGGESFWGVIDDFAVFSKTLSATEIKTLFFDGGASLLLLL